MFAGPGLGLSKPTSRDPYPAICWTKQVPAFRASTTSMEQDRVAFGIQVRERRVRSWFLYLVRPVQWLCTLSFFSSVERNGYGTLVAFGFFALRGVEERAVTPSLNYVCVCVPLPPHIYPHILGELCWYARYALLQNSFSCVRRLV